MPRVEVIQSSVHHNGSAVPFVAAIIDDPSDGDTKLVIQFGDEGCTAVLSLDVLINDEDVSSEAHGYHGDRYDEGLRAVLWSDE